MPRNIELLLLSTVENLGIVGDICKVKKGYARNYLIPMGLAEPPTPTKIESLKEARAKAQSELAMLRQAREELLERMVEVSIELVRSCNDQGALYGSVTQRDIADALQEHGYDVGVRSIRLAHAIRRVGSYDVPIQFEKDLRTDITVVVQPDHPLEEAEEAATGEEGAAAGAERPAEPAEATDAAAES
ncbi:MAG: 50S ribosomal protein L9 [Planctomycetota bacterium]|jgi:large subunit ribosomal protein L9